MEDKKRQRSGSKRKMLVKMIYSSLLRRKSRMLVALLAVAIGGTILSGLMTIYYDIPRQMGKEFRSYGANMVFLPVNESVKVDGEDFTRLKKDLSAYDVEGITPLSFKNIRVNEQPVIMAGTYFDQIDKTRPFWKVSGNLPKNENEVLVGVELANKFRVEAGSVLNLEYKIDEENYSTNKFTVSGIVESGKSEDAMVFVDFDKMVEIVGDSEIVDVIETSISADKEALDNIVKKYESSETLTAKLVKMVASSENTVLSKLQALVWLVSIIVLILTLISVGTTMMAAVMERRKEIGLKKALGAPNKSITREFLVEGLFLGVFGGIFGMILGFLFAQSVSMKVFGRAIDIQLSIAIITIVISVIITVAASFIPVKRATEIDPAVVLKGE